MKQIKRKNKIGFTLVEIIVVCGIVAVFMGTAMIVFTNFRSGYSKSESTAVLMQEAVLFISRLRNDLNNAVLDTSNPEKAKQIDANSNSLSFKIYDSKSGEIFPVSYNLRKSDEKISILRKVGMDAEKVVLADNVASISWVPEFENFTGKASGTYRLSLNFSMKLRDSQKKNSKREFSLSTRIFPVRLNKQINKP